MVVGLIVLSYYYLDTGCCCCCHNTLYYITHTIQIQIYMHKSVVLCTIVPGLPGFGQLLSQASPVRFMPSVSEGAWTTDWIVFRDRS